MLIDFCPFCVHRVFITYTLALMSLHSILRLKPDSFLFPLDLVPEKKKSLILHIDCFALFFFHNKITSRAFYANTLKEGFSILQLLAPSSYLKQWGTQSNFFLLLKKISSNVSLLFNSMLTMYVIGFSLKGYRNPWQVSPFFSVSCHVFVCLVFWSMESNQQALSLWRDHCIWKSGCQS